jgi:hypothetical protein
VVTNEEGFYSMANILAKPDSIKIDIMSRVEDTTGGALAKKKERSHAVAQDKARTLAKGISTVGKQMSSSASMSNTQWGKLWPLPKLQQSVIMGWSTLLLTFMLINIVQAADFAKLDEAIPWAFVAELAPVFDFDGDSCLPSAGISRNGQKNPGLEVDRTSIWECRNGNFLDTSNTLHRYTCTSKSGSTYCSHFYALYFEVDHSTFGGHRHDWEYAAIWTKNGAITHGSVSVHGRLETKAASDLPFENGHMKVVYHQDGLSTHAMRFAGRNEIAENPYGRFVTPTLTSWDSLYGEGIDNKTMIAKLNNFDYGSANVPGKDSDFLDDINRFKPPDYPIFSSLYSFTPSTLMSVLLYLLY